MKRSTVCYAVLILIFVSLLGVPVALTEEDFSHPDEGNNSGLDPDANACFEGGTLAGKCDSEILWIAGWFLIRFEHGIISLEDFPAQYAWILPDHGSENDLHDDHTHDDHTHHDDETHDDETHDDETHDDEFPLDDIAIVF